MPMSPEDVLLTDRVAVVTGGASGLGLATTKRLLDRGVLIRDVGLPGWLRVTAGTPAETDAFLNNLSWRL